MATTYRIYGNSDPSEEGFPTPQSIQKYIAGEIFDEKHQGRYRYTQKTFANIIVLSREGIAYGHFDIDHSEEPTGEDRQRYSKTNNVFIVTKSTLYERPVKLYRKDTPESGPESFRYNVNNPGLEIFEADFQKILGEAGETFPFFPPGEIDRRYCRLCYNVNGWRKPSGAAEEAVSYFTENGFGHEEWLLRYEWCLNGMKYGFLQPFTKHLTKYQGSTFALKLYTIHRGDTFFAGTISKVYVPHDDELAAAYRQFEANGWIDQMKEEVAAVGGNVSALGGNEPNLVLNVRFNPADVNFHKDMLIFPQGSKPTRANYYNLYEDDDVPPPTIVQTIPPAGQNIPQVKREELQYLRAAQQGMVVDPVHARMQNRLYDQLCKQHGPDAVGFEIDFVDLRLTVGHEVTFFEIKTDSEAKRCIRNALGQLVEYSTYIAQQRADKWVVVGDPVPNKGDIAYLEYLRNRFDLPLYYSQFDWESGGLTQTF